MNYIAKGPGHLAGLSKETDALTKPRPNDTSNNFRCNCTECIVANCHTQALFTYFFDTDVAYYQARQFSLKCGGDNTVFLTKSFHTVLGMKQAMTKSGGDMSQHPQRNWRQWIVWQTTKGGMGLYSRWRQLCSLGRTNSFSATAACAVREARGFGFPLPYQTLHTWQIFTKMAEYLLPQEWHSYLAPYFPCIELHMTQRPITFNTLR